MVADPNSHDAATLSLRGARFIMANELPKGHPINESKIKELAESAKMTCRAPYGTTDISFITTHVMHITANKLPPLDATDQGVWRRLKVIPFDVTFRSQKEVDIANGLFGDGAPVKLADETLLNHFRQNPQGVMGWLLYGWLLWADTGLEDEEFVVNATDEYQISIDIIEEFLQTHCEDCDVPDVQGATLYKAYVDFCKTYGYMSLSNSNFGQELKLKGKKNFRTKNGTRWALSLINEIDFSKTFQPREY
jgi:putative DNA primase/helicase